MSTYATERLAGAHLRRAFALALGWEFRKGMPPEAHAKAPECKAGVWARYTPGGEGARWVCVNCFPDAPFSQGVEGHVLDAMNKHGIQITRDGLRGPRNMPDTRAFAAHLNVVEGQTDYRTYTATGLTVEVAVMRVIAEWRLGPHTELPEDL
jgi:hypothetical protein